MYFEFDLGDRKCREFLARAQLIVWEAQIPNPIVVKGDNEEYNETFQTIFDAIGHAEQVKDK